MYYITYYYLLHYSLRKVLFLDSSEGYCGKDNWPPETDRGAILQMMTEGSLKGDTLMRILVIGLDRDLPLSPSDALDMTDKLVARAANVHTSGEEEGGRKGKGKREGRWRNEKGKREGREGMKEKERQCQK